MSLRTLLIRGALIGGIIATVNFPASSVSRAHASKATVRQKATPPAPPVKTTNPPRTDSGRVPR